MEREKVFGEDDMRDYDSCYYDIIWNEKELKKFYDIILARKPLLQNEVRYCSLSARNKYLDEEERKVYHLGRSEMFGKQVVRHDTWEAYLQAVRRYECNIQGYLTKNGLPYPQKVMVCYANINPSDVLGVLREMNKSIDENKDALVCAAIKGSKEGILDAFYKIRKVEDTMISMYARNIGTKVWVDFDFDIEKDLVPQVVEIMDYFFKKLAEKKLAEKKEQADPWDPEHYWVDTKGGVHMLFYKDALKFDPSCICAMGFVALDIAMKLRAGEFPQHIDIESAKKVSDNVEIIQNDNGMVPAPGTLQGGHEVRMLDKPWTEPFIFETLVTEMVDSFGVKWETKAQAKRKQLKKVKKAPGDFDE